MSIADQERNSMMALSALVMPGLQLEREALPGHTSTRQHPQGARVVQVKLSKKQNEKMD